MSTSTGGDDSTPAGDPSRQPKAFTPPKGRPTRSRDHPPRRRQLFGPVAQWIAAALLLGVIVLVIVMLTGGGDFNPLNGSGAVVLDELVRIPMRAAGG